MNIYVNLQTEIDPSTDCYPSPNPINSAILLMEINSKSSMGYMCVECRNSHLDLE